MSRGRLIFFDPMGAKAWFAEKCLRAISLSQVRKTEEISVLAGLIENGWFIRRVVDRVFACKKLSQAIGEERAAAQLRKELERLALSAPHMLQDLGFERDLTACSSEKVVWRLGAHSVIVSSSKQAAVSV